MDGTEALQTLIEEIKTLRGMIAAQSQPLVIHGRKFQIVERKEAARHLSISEDTFDRLVKTGFLPPPFAPDFKAGRGNKLQRWDLYDVIEWFTRYRQN